MAAAAAAAAAAQWPQLVRRHCGTTDRFMQADLARVRQLYAHWQRVLPGVTPYYAVKCNSDPRLLRTLADAGAGFDCASANELGLVADMGVAASRLLHAHPCKPPGHIAHAAAAGVDLTTFDSADELHKLRRHHPRTEVLLRIRCDDGTARCKLGGKYGAEESEVADLLAAARAAGINVRGVAFHVGSAAGDPQAYARAVRASAAVCRAARALGHDADTLDVGGGFTSRSLDSIADVVRPLLRDLWGGKRVIAEPGRYFAETPFTLFCQVHGKRVRGGRRKYWISDGLYGLFNCVLYDKARPVASPLRLTRDGAGRPADGNDGDDDPQFASTIFGPTCDGLDVVIEDCSLPELSVGDWVVFPDMGAYTLPGASDFNGFEATKTPVVYTG
ncbi:MAG: hypothetical protein BJ554DRAFT_4574 [Olpidium bornovanus]|uniref:ornithine decarboxylase n=1 Tax=Olpidium bornovanus TaxID=278681 RepID=A0A8H8DFD5_9FUNG|nr:MAG: hypothetical protein BJ554DRAFT_4574 [Olpidium bornovanus]